MAFVILDAAHATGAIDCYQQLSIVEGGSHATHRNADIGKTCCLSTYGCKQQDKCKKLLHDILYLETNYHNYNNYV